MIILVFNGLFLVIFQNKKCLKIIEGIS